MNSFLLYILKSTFCISLFYLGFRMLLRKETFFRLNRVLLMSAVIFSAIIPAIQLPQFIQPAAQNEWMSAFPETVIPQVAQPISEETVQPITAPTEQPTSVFKEEFSWLKLVQNGYLAGIAISFLILIYGIVSILALFRKARFMQMDGFRLLIVDHEVPPFSFGGRFVIISQADYDAHQQTILAHEEAHIRLNHFFDLVVLETVKLFHWFNPAMYWLIRDMKEIHEFQADEYTLRKGIDATQYQILIIQKSVGSQRFALANSFNHCQIKKRITMMTKQKTSKARLWKVATFLPLLALLLMAFGKPGENIVPKMMLCPRGTFQTQIVGSGNMQVSVSLDSFWMSNEITNKEFRAFYEDIKRNPTDSLFWIELEGISADPTLKPTLKKVSLGDIGKMIITTDIWKDQPERSLYKDYFLNPKFDKFPVLGVSAQGANFYCLWLKQNEMEQLKNKKQSVSIDFRLPTEVEWEYAAKQSLDQNISKDNSLHSSKDGRMNSWGISNLGGNVAEWTSSKEIKQGKELKIVRGGSWKTGWSINERKLLDAISSSNDIGFRIVKSKIVTALSNESSPPPTPPSAKPAPLYVVDGMILKENPMNKDMSGDIQSVSVLNSKSATEMFGEKGKNGAVIITTKIIGADARNSRYITSQPIAPQKNKDGVFVTSEEMPLFPGGSIALRRFITEKVKYPVEAQKDNIQGKVYVSFVVNSKGKVEKAKIARGVREDLDAEAIRVVSLLPDWTPGKNKGEAVDVAYTIPVQFGLQSNESTPGKINNTVFLVVDEMPRFPGGETELMKFIASNIKYPEQAKTDKAQGEVMVNFVVRSDGKIENPKIIKGVHPALDAEAIRIVNILPAWRPGKQDGKIVDVSYTVPVKFNL